MISQLRTAVAELSWLLTRGYGAKAAVKLVGDRYTLTERQRLAVTRAACSDQSLTLRCESCSPIESLSGQGVIIDGFNLIITLEAALSGGLLLLCRDQSMRDLSSVHGSYRAVDETDAALALIGEELESLRVNSVEWILDQPISNSGRLAKRLREIAAARGWSWTVDLFFNPDERVVASRKIAITSDSVILDRATRWANFKRHVIEKCLPDSWIVDLRS